MAINSQEIGRLIKARREYVGLQQQEVAGLLSMTQGNYSRIESGRVAVSTPDLARIAEVLKVRTSYLLGEQDPGHDILDDDAIMFYRGIRPDMKPAALASLRGLYEQFRADAESDPIGKKAE